MHQQFPLFAAGVLLLHPFAIEHIGTAAPGPAEAHRPELVAQVGHSARVTAVALSGDGKWLVTGGDVTARLWELATGKEVRTFRGHAEGVLAVALSADGKWLATGSQDRSARLWELATGKVVRTFLGHSGPVYSVSLSADGKRLATGGDDSARLWDAATGKEVRHFPGLALSVALSPDGKSLATAGEETARLWDAAAGKEVRAFVGHSSLVTSVALSGEGKMLATGSWDRTARLWDVRTGKQLQVLRGHSSFVTSVCLSGDGKLLATGSQDRSARLWEAATGKEVGTPFRGHATSVCVVLSGDGKRLVTGADRVARLWDTAAGKEVRAFQGYCGRVTSIATSRDGQWLVTGSGYPETTARQWDLTTGKAVRAFQGHAAGVSAVALSADGKWLATGSWDKTARLWEAATGKVVRTFAGHDGWIYGVALSGDGKWLAAAGEDRSVRLWDASTGKPVRTLRGRLLSPAVALSGDGGWLATGSGNGLASSSDHRVSLYEAAGGREVHTFRGLSVALSGDGKWLAIGREDHTARLVETGTGREVRAFRGHSGRVTFVALVGDGNWLLTGGEDRTARLWNLATGTEVQAFRGHADTVTGVELVARGKRLVTSGDNTTRVWDVATGKELCRLVGFRDGSWAVLDVDGRFDASNAGDVQGLHWVVGNEPIALKQLKERYYDPGLLAKYLGFNKEALRNVAAFRDVKLFPAADVKPLAPGSTKLAVQLTNRGGGLGKVQVFVNGRELLADARGKQLDPDAATAELTIDLAGAHLKPGEANRVRVVPWNAEGYLSSRGLDLSFVPVGRPDERPIELYAIVAGVSKYASDKLNLRFAAKDAQNMAAALRAGAKRLFGADKVHLTLLCDGDEPEALPPTRANLEKAFAAVKQSRPGDVLVVYLAGHGVAFPDGEQEVYCFLTKEARSVTRDAFRDPAIRRLSCITSTELTEWLKQTPALKQVLVLDTCAAGAAAGKLMEHRDVGADQIRAIDRLQNRTGFHVLMGCAADRVSYEASQYSQGVLTYALLQAMRGARLREGAYVDVSQWFQYAADEVPLLARHVGGIQRPLVMAPRGTSFDIGQLLAEDRKAIPLAQVRPLLLRPVLLNADDLTDNLDLMPRLRTALADASYAGVRGPGKVVGAVYVDADELPGAVRPSGTYTVKGDKVRVTLALSRDGAVVARFQVDGLRTDLPALAARLVAAVEERLSKL